MDEQKQKKFESGEVILGFLVGLIIDGLAFVADFFSFGSLGWFIQAIVWPFIKNFWLKKGGTSVLNDPVKAYLVPILVQGIPFLPTMCATIVVVMYLENHPEKLGIMNKTKSPNELTLLKPKKISKKTKESIINLKKPIQGTALSNTNAPRIFSMPSSPIRTQNNPLVQKYNEE